MSNTQLATTERAPLAVASHGVRFSNFDEMARFCSAVVNSRLAPKGFDTPEAVMIAVQRGLELGLPPLQALDSIAIINGRPCIFGDAPLALAKGSPQFVDCIESWTGAGDTLEAVCTIKRAKAADLTRSFSVADAKKASLWGKAGPWSNYPKRMLQMRARSWALRDAFPDVLRGIGIKEEQQDIPPAPAKAKLILPGDPAPAAETPALKRWAEAKAQAQEAINQAEAEQ
jgi:hypothetical protein